VTRCGECVEPCVNGGAIGAAWRNAAIQLDANEESIIAVGGDGTERLAVNGHHTNSVLSSALCDELFCPGAEAINRFVDDERHLVATLTRQCAHDAAEGECVIPRWLWIAALCARCAPRCEEWIKINPEECRRDKANEAERRVAATNVGGIQEETTGVNHLRNSVNARRRVTDGSEVCRWLLCGAAYGELLLIQLVRVCGEGERLRRGA